MISPYATELQGAGALLEKFSMSGIAKNAWVLILSVVLVLAGVSPVLAKEYNKRMHLAPEQRAKVDRVIADAYSQEDSELGGVTEVGCGGLEIGNIDSIQPGQSVDRDIIITGDVINVATGCR